MRNRYFIAALLLASCAPGYSWADCGDRGDMPGDRGLGICAAPGGPGGGYFDWSAFQSNLDAARQNRINNQRYNAAMDNLVRTYGPQAGAPTAWGQDVQNNALQQTLPSVIDATNLAPQDIQSQIDLRNAQAALLNAQAQRLRDERQRNVGLRRPAFGVVLDTTQVAPEGLAVLSVRPGEVADRAGIVAGDIVMTYGGLPMNEPRELQLAVSGTKPGETKSIEILRDGQEVTVVASF